MLKSIRSVARAARAAGPAGSRTRYLHAGAVRHSQASSEPPAEASSSSSSRPRYGLKQRSTPPEVEERPKPPHIAELTPAEAWKLSRVHPDVVKLLAERYPSLIAPTPAQLAFLMSVMRGDVDVHYKDYMGRGKTFSLVLAALSIAKTGKQVVLLLPTPHLVHQVEEYFSNLAGDVPVSVMSSRALPDWNARVIVATPGPLLGAAGEEPLHKLLPDLSHVLVDEADTQFGPLPGRYETSLDSVRLPINRHPPALVHALNSLLNIQHHGDHIDFSNRTKAHTVWSSATLGPSVRRFVYGRGWAHGGIIDLDFTNGATNKQVGTRDSLAEIAGKVGAMVTEPFQVKPEHYAFTVDSRGVISPLSRSRFQYDTSRGETLNSMAKMPPGLPPTMIEAVAFLSATSPPPRGTYSLAVLPDNASIREAQAEMHSLGVSVAPLVPESLVGGIPAPPEDVTPPILISKRSAVPGLHLPHLHTVYLLNGLDHSGLSPAQLRSGGRKMNESMYGIIAGRLGRFATPAHKGQPQRVISLVEKDGVEEAALRDMFAGVYGDTGMRLSRWTGEL